MASVISEKLHAGLQSPVWTRSTAVGVADQVAMAGAWETPKPQDLLSWKAQAASLDRAAYDLATSDWFCSRVRVTAGHEQLFGAAALCGVISCSSLCRPPVLYHQASLSEHPRSYDRPRT